MSSLPQHVFAPAKINLFLHILGKRKDGYHNLESLVAFADVGDSVEIKPADSFSFQITGPFSDSFEQINHYSDSDNLVVGAARYLSQATDNALNVSIHLVKNLPLSSGLGGGSSDAAACIWGLQNYWGLPRDADYLAPLLLKLGADVPVCYQCQPSIMRGIGEDVIHAPDMPEIPIILINPAQACPTAEVFSRHNRVYSDKVSFPKRFKTTSELIDFLKTTRNDLYAPALNYLPEIRNVLHALDAQKTCLFSRMSGSGASCFGLFENMEDTQKAADLIKLDNPDWHVFTATLNSPVRY